MEWVPMSALLLARARDSESRQPIIDAAGLLGFEVVSERPATLALRLPLDRFGALFGREPARTPAQPRPGDTYSPPGFAPQELPVPPELAAWLEAIGVDAPDIRLARGVYH